MSTSSAPSEIKALAATAQGFDELTAQYRRELQIHCYRILGSLHEAEDMVQETLIKAWKNVGTFEGRASFRSWLYKIATNTCLDFLDTKRSRRLLPFQMAPASNPKTILPPALEIPWLEPLPDEWLEDIHAIDPEAHYSESESVSLSFLTALQLLPSRQRAVLILRDVLEFSAIETAEVLELTISSVNSLLHRARKTLAENYQSETAIKPLTDAKTQSLLDHYMRAWQNADVDGLVALLKQDALIAMPPSPSWYCGKLAVGKFVAATVLGMNAMFPGKPKNRWRFIATRSNAAPALAMYLRTDQHQYQAFGLQVLIIKRNKISQIINFIDPSLLERFGLPNSL